MRRANAHALKLKNLILFSPYVTKATLLEPDIIGCRFGVIDEDFRIEVDQNGIARLITSQIGSVLNLELGPIEDSRAVVRSLDYFISGFPDQKTLVG